MTYLPDKQLKIASAISTEAREQAINRAMEFIYSVARDPTHFAEHGSDLLSCFHLIASTSKDKTLRKSAREMGRERASIWRRDYPALPRDADADTVIDFVYGSYAADRLGARDPTLKAEIRRAARRFSARDYHYFDPREEPPPLDVPEQCDCGEWNARGRKTCRECKQRLSMQSRYGVWYDALIRSYSASRYGVILGARYEHFLAWLPHLRPYRSREGGANPDFYDTVYAVTHIVYTLNDYSRYRLSPRWLPEEFAFLKASMKEAIAMEDAEMVGEIIDSLRAFGLEESHPLVREGVAYLLSMQNADGSWGEQDDDYIYGRYHPTWTAIDGLRDYAWRGRGLSFPKLLPVLRAWARKHPGHVPRRRSPRAETAVGKTLKAGS